uniref:Putative two-component system sensor protein n=1 Tax=uncultured bacterium BLR12 TaxID=506514 RepID=C0INH3_9BACT|nr:putative two-component system sensor protein [uncultured bacterium BLR12]
MEFDNDRIIKHAYKIEIFYWVLLGIMNPLVNSLTLFPRDIKIWIILLLVNIILLPAYLFYAAFIVPRFLFKKRYVLFILTSSLFFIGAHLLLVSIYSIVLQFGLSVNERSYFSYNYTTITRECLWILMNMSMAAAIAFIKRGEDEKDLVVNLQKDNISFRLKYLRAQLNPHFLFNTLNSIYSLSLQKSDRAPEMVIKLSDLMRYLIYECTDDKVALNKEIEFIQNYIEIEKIRYQADVRFTVEGNTDGIMIEPFLFISFIENGFKHAFDSAFTNPFIYITIKVAADQIVLNVINNTNLDLETQAKRISGTGITNSKSLLELLYPNAYALDIIQTEKEEARKNNLRIENAKKRLETFYPDSHTLDVILSNNAFTVSLIIKPRLT